MTHSVHRPRRRSAGRLALVGVGVAVLALTTACSGSSDDSGPSGAAITHAGLETTTTGTATGDIDAVTWYGDYRPLYGLDPIKLADYPEETVIPNLCEPMLRVAPDYEVSDGMVAYTQDSPTKATLTLRDGVRFGNGTPVTAQDVAFSLNRNLDPKEASNYGYAFANVKKIAVSGDRTVTVDFASPDATFTNTLATLGGAVVEKKAVLADGAAFGSPDRGVSCVGPFTFVSYDGTSTLVMKRNDSYWDTAHAAKAKTFTFVFPGDIGALGNGLSTGAIDGGFNIPASLLTKLGSTDKGKVYLGDKGSTPVNVDVLMTRTTGTLADTTVRQALSMALDREAIAKTIFAGTADPLYQVSGPGLWGYARDAYEKAYGPLVKKADVAGAKKLVDEAGATGKKATFGYPAGDPQSQQLATVLEQTAKKIGIDLKIVGLPNQQYGNLFADPKSREAYDAILTKNYVELPEPLAMDNLYASPHGATNFSGYDNPQVDALLQKATGTLDDDARATLVIEAEKQLSKDLPSIPVVQPRAVVFENSRLTGAPLTFSYMVSPWAAAVGAK